MEQDVNKEFQSVYQMIVNLQKENGKLLKLIKDHISDSSNVEILERR
jgi:hypothetical protein